MTQEEKALAYDAALERMKSWVRGEHPECFTEAQKAAEFIFPELAESEDKKIIREIAAFFRQSAGGYLNTSIPCKTYSKWLAWIEKQDEQRYLTSVDLGDTAGDKGCIFNYSNATISEDENIKAFLIKTINQVPNDSLLWEEIDKASVIAWIEKQGEFLRLQNSWKPSDRELETLRLIAEKDGTCLKGLYEKLKKLK